MAITRKEYENAREKALKYFEKASIVITDIEKENLEVSDFGLSRLNEVGLELVIYVSTERCSAKEAVLFPGQICPEHRHPPLSEDNPGKEETFRCRWGEIYLYVEGRAVENPKACVPDDIKKHLTVWNEIILKPGDQYKISPNTRHWFQGGPEGAVFSEFSTKNVDEADIFEDPRVKRITEFAK